MMISSFKSLQRTFSTIF